MLDYIFCQLPTLETERTYLRKLLYSDKSDIFAYAKNPKVAEHVIWDAHQSEFDTLEFLNTVYAAYNKNKAAPWGIELKETGKIIGTAGFVNWEKENQKAEIGYVLSKDYWKKGIMTEVVKDIINFGFEKIGLTEISARSKPANVASQKVLIKCGLRYNGLHKKQMLIKGKLEDMDLFSLAKDDWENN